MSLDKVRNFRPARASELFGQEHIQQVVKNWMVEPSQIPKVILFSGPYGCGKTSIARMIAGSLTTSTMDIIEINSAEARGIDEVRDLQDKSRFAPMSPARIYIIDEIQKMTPDAQSALLKTLEEPPPRIYFFLCTTNPEMLNAALKSRCAKMEVKLLNEAAALTLIDHLVPGIGEVEKRTIVHNSQGHARDICKTLEMYLQGGLEKAVAGSNGGAINTYSFYTLLQDYIKGDYTKLDNGITYCILNSPQTVDWLNQYLDAIYSGLGMSYVEILKLKTLKKQYLLSDVEYAKAALVTLFHASNRAQLAGPVDIFYKKQ